jgi:hypothetical protein
MLRGNAGPFHMQMSRDDKSAHVAYMTITCPEPPGNFHHEMIPL